MTRPGGKHRAPGPAVTTPHDLTRFVPRHCAGAGLVVSWCLHRHPGEAPLRVIKGWRR